MSEDKYFHQAHFCSLPSQSNVYGMTKVKSQLDKTFKVLVSSGDACQISCFGFQRDEQEGLLNPISKEVEAGDLSIPDGAEIICLDAFRYDGALILGFCFTKEDSVINNTVQWVNAANLISTSWEPKADFTESGLMQGLCSVELEFGCLFLKHKLIEHNGVFVNLCLMSGDDSKIHLFTLEREDFGNTIKCSEVACAVFFPELDNLKSCVISLDFLEFSKKRITAMGCDDGTVLVYLVDLESYAVVQSWETRHDHPILVVKLFSDTTNQNSGELNICHLFASSVTTPSVVYRSVLKDGFTNVKILPDSNSYDLVICACLADIDWDGEQELLLGTNGHQLLAYKWHCDERDMEDIQPLEKQTVQENVEDEDDLWLPVEEYRLFYERKFAHSLMGLEYVDMTGDGLCELAILSSDGVIILQHNLENAKKVLMDRLKKSQIKNGKE